MEKIVYERDTVRVRIVIADDGRSGTAWIDYREGPSWCHARNTNGSAIFYGFSIPGGRWPWNRSLQRTVFLTINRAQKYAEALLRSKQELVVVSETLDALAEVIS